MIETQFASKKYIKDIVANTIHWKDTFFFLEPAYKKWTTQWYDKSSQFFLLRQKLQPKLRLERKVIVVKKFTQKKSCKSEGRRLAKRSPSSKRRKDQIGKWGNPCTEQLSFGCFVHDGKSQLRIFGRGEKEKQLLLSCPTDLIQKKYCIVKVCVREKETKTENHSSCRKPSTTLLL